MRRTGIVGAAAALLLACGGGGAEQRLEEASRALAEAREVVERERETVAERQAAVEAAEKRLADARRSLREAEEALLELEARVDVSATDAALFRTIQRRLLEDEALEDVAIAARVEKGVVSLSGEVSNADLRERALEIARGTPGVASVQSQIRVPAPPPGGKKPGK